MAGKSSAKQEGWVGDAWREHLNGVSIYALSKKYGCKYETVKNNLRKHAANRAAERREGYDPTEAYIDGLEEDLKHSTRLLLAAEQDTAQIGALKLRVDIRKLIAGGQGVVTERKGVEVTEKPDVSQLNADEAAKFARLSAKVLNGRPDDADAEDADNDEA